MSIRKFSDLAPRLRPASCGLRRATALLTVAVLSACGGDSGGETSLAAPLAATPALLTGDQPTAEALVRVTEKVGLDSLRLLRNSEAFEEIERLTRDLLPKIFDSSDSGNDLSVDCRRHPLQFAPFLCYGKISFQANQRTSDGVVTATTVFSLQFDSFQVLTPGFDRLRISGGIKLDYLTDATVSPRRGTIRYESSGISTNKDGEIIAASDGAVTVQSGDGTVVIETDRERLLDVGSDSSGDQDGKLRSGSTRANFQSGYADFAWQGWPIAGGKPEVGAQMTATGAESTSATVTVLEVTPDGIRYVVLAGSAGQSSRFEVFVPN